MANRLRIFALPRLALVLSHARAQSQSLPPPATANSMLSVNVRVVVIDTVVHDSRGNLVPNLDKSAFILREDNKPVPIRYFSHGDDLPLIIGLMVDTSASQRDYAADKRRASATFLQTMITRPADRVFVECFDTLAVLLQPMTSDVQKLQTSLNLLAAPLPTPSNSKAGTLLYDAILDTAQKVVTHQPGRRAIVILTDGDDDGSTNTFESAIREAQFANVAIYSVLYTREALGQSNFVYPAGVDIMKKISTAIGGSLFIVTQGVPIAQIFAAIAEDLRSQYRLGFTSTPSTPGTFHPRDLKSTNPFLTVEARTARSHAHLRSP